jgi:hypothetical protein
MFPPSTSISFTTGGDSTHLTSSNFVEALIDGDDDTPPNFTKRKHPKKGREKETKGKDQSPGKQAAEMRWATRRKGNH